MAFIKGFEYDIFISYSHVDNLTVKSESMGWVDYFHDYLQVGLSRKAGRADMVRIWRDEELDGTQLFDDVIRNRINRSALFIALLSTGYLASEYCMEELKWFNDKAAFDGWYKYLRYHFKGGKWWINGEWHDFLH